MIYVVRELEGHKAYQIPIGDTQIGEPWFAKDKLQGYLDWIKARENVLILLLGDLFEVPKKTSKATDVWLKDRLMPRDAMRLAVDMFGPVSDRIVGGVIGNHENRMQQEFGRNPMEELFDRIGLPEETLSAGGMLFKMQLNAVPYTTYALHGWGGARTTGGQVNKTEQLGDVVRDADVFVTGHEHVLHATRWDSILAEQFEERRQYYINVGCFSYYTLFQENISRRMPNVGAPRIRFDGARRDVHVSI